MKLVGLLRHDPEWADQQLADGLEERGFTVALHDVREASLDDLTGYRVVLNRVYASVSGRDLPAVERALELVEQLTARGTRCVNGPRASRADYDKYFAYRCMVAAGVPTPATAKVEAAPPDRMVEAVADFAAERGDPVVFKPNTSGRGRDVIRIPHLGEVETRVLEALESGHAVGYHGDWVVQEFIPATRPHDCRICIIGGRLSHSLARTLVSRGDEPPWVASLSLGSRFSPYDPDDRELGIARAATAAIGADCNDVDMAFGEAGPMIIENNPTPQLAQQAAGHLMPGVCDALASVITAEFHATGGAPA